MSMRVIGSLVRLAEKADFSGATVVSTKVAFKTEFSAAKVCFITQMELSILASGLMTSKKALAFGHSKFISNSNQFFIDYSPNGDSYEGVFRNGKKDGFGIYTYPDGSSL